MGRGASKLKQTTNNISIDNDNEENDDKLHQEKGHPSENFAEFADITTVSDIKTITTTVTANRETLPNDNDDDYDDEKTHLKDFVACNHHITDGDSSGCGETGCSYYACIDCYLIEAGLINDEATIIDNDDDDVDDTSMFVDVPDVMSNHHSGFEGNKIYAGKFSNGIIPPDYPGDDHELNINVSTANNATNTTYASAIATGLKDVTKRNIDRLITSRNCQFIKGNQPQICCHLDKEEEQVIRFNSCHSCSFLKKESTPNEHVVVCSCQQLHAEASVNNKCPLRQPNPRLSNSNEFTEAANPRERGGLINKQPIGMNCDSSKNNDAFVRIIGRRRRHKQNNRPTQSSEQSKRSPVGGGISDSRGNNQMSTGAEVADITVATTAVAETVAITTRLTNDPVRKGDRKKFEKPLTLLTEKVTGFNSSLIKSAAAAAAVEIKGRNPLATTVATTATASCKDELMRQCQQEQCAITKLPLKTSSSPSSNQNNNNNNIILSDCDALKENRNIETQKLANLTQSSIKDRSKQQQQSAITKTAIITLETLPQDANNIINNNNNSCELEAINKKLKLEADTKSCATTKTFLRKIDQQQQQQQGDYDKAKVKLQKEQEDKGYIDWNLLTHKYRKMPQHPNRDKLCWQLHSSCFCRLLIYCFQTLFPIFTSFKNYQLPGDLITDLIAGSTVAVLHIPQGMAYGLLAGVDPIYGLYVSFVPVIVMALMSKSRHVSYGTFAILSMMLANACDLAKLHINQQQQSNDVMSHSSNNLATAAAVADNDGTSVVLVNNHRMAPSPLNQILATDKIGNNLVASSEKEQTVEQSTAQDGWFISSVLKNSAPIINDDAAAAADPSVFIMPSNIEILTCICIVVGLIQVTMSLLRLGILSLMFSDQLVSSFTAASAFHVITSQVPNLFDLSTPPVSSGLFRVCRTWWALTMRLLEGFNYYTALLSLMSIIFLLIIKEIIEPLIRRRLLKSLTCLPSELFLMACIIFNSWYWKFENNYGIEVIGHVPTNLPAPKSPRIDLIPIVFQDALTIALVSFAMNLSLGQVYAKRNRYQLDPNQELFSLGTSNVVGSFFSCFPCASSLSRSAVQSSLNVKSQVCSLFSCCIVISIICYFASILHDLPKSTLSCIIIVALKGILFQVKDLYENWRLSKLDAIVWITTFTSVLAFGVTYGLVLGIAASLFMVFVRLLNPNHSILGQLPGTEIYVDRNAFMDCHEIEQVKIFRFNSALCYLNRTMFKACIEKSLPMIYRRKSLVNSFYADQARKLSDTEKVKFLIIDCSALAYCDYSGAETLVDIVEELEEFKVQVYLAACPVKLVDMIEKMKRTRVLEHNVHPTITDALNHARYLRSRQMQQCSVCSSCNTDNCTCSHSVINGLP